MICIAAILLTLAIMLATLSPLGPQREGGDMLFSLLIAPLLAIWAVGPYAVANRFAHDTEGRAAWVFVVVQVIVGLPVLGVYADALVFRPQTEAEIGLVFAIFPIYQFIGVLAAYYGVRLWRRES